jgi:hypothetical protein
MLLTLFLDLSVWHTAIAAQPLEMGTLLSISIQMLFSDMVEITHSTHQRRTSGRISGRAHSFGFDDGLAFGESWVPPGHSAEAGNRRAVVNFRGEWG